MVHLPLCLPMSGDHITNCRPGACCCCCWLPSTRRMTPHHLIISPATARCVDFSSLCLQCIQYADFICFNFVQFLWGSGGKVQLLFSVSNEKLNTIIIEKLLYLLIYNLVQFFKLNYNFQQKLFPFLCWRLRNDDKWSQNLCKTFNCGQGAWLEVVITQYIFSLVGRMDRADLFNTPPNQKSIN